MKTADKITYTTHVASEEDLRRAIMQHLQDIVTERRSRFTGHIVRMLDANQAKRALKWSPLGEIERPRSMCLSTLKKDYSQNNLDLEYLRERRCL